MNVAATDAWAVTRAQLVELVARRVENCETAEDIVQDVLERLVRTDIATVTNVQAWLYRAARNAIVDHYRKRRTTTALDQVTIDVPAIDEAEPGAGAELTRCLRPLVEQLPADYREAIMVVDLEGHTQADAARAAGLSTSGMKSRVQRGRGRLAALLRQCCVLETDRTGAIVGYTPRDGRCSC